MKIVLIQTQGFINGSGGVEKVCTFLANNFALKGHEVIIATNQDIEGNPVYPLNDSIKIVNIFDSKIKQLEPVTIKKYRGINLYKWLKYKLAKKYVKKINKENFNQIYEYNLYLKSQQWKIFIDNLNPDFIITMSIFSFLEISYRNEYHIPIINSINGRPDYDYTNILENKSLIETKHIKQSYSKLSGVQVLFDSYKEFLPDTFKGLCKVIANPVSQISDHDIVKHGDEKKQYTIISIGRLDISHKQQDIAIKIFAKIAHKYPNWNLEFWGVGEDQSKLEKLINSLNLSNRIYIRGFTENPFEKLKQSDIFILPSKYEGLPLALIEAMSIGLPSLGFQSCSGVNELIKNNINGYLSENEESMIIQLEKLMQSSEVRSKFGNQAHQDMKEYSPEKIFTNWKDFVEEFN